MTLLQRFITTIAALWAGIMIGVGYVFAPVLFQLMPASRQFAGSITGQALTITAYVSMAAGVIIMLAIRYLNNRAGFSTPNAPLILVIAALFLAIFGQFVLFPEIVQARDFGNTRLSFSALHAISNIVYLVQILVILALNWCLYKPIQKPAYIDTATKKQE